MMQQESRIIPRILGRQMALRLTVSILTLVAQLPLLSQIRTTPPPKCLGGTLDAPIQLEVFSDFQCSYCRSFYLETITQVLIRDLHRLTPFVIR